MMAQRRLISRRATASDKMLALGANDRARWLWASLLPYTDKAGRINANPVILKTTVYEGYPYTVQDIAAALDALADVGLVKLYRTKRHELVLEYVKFGDFNTPHKREPGSDFPGPSGSGSEPRTATEALRETSRNLLGTVPEQSGNEPADVGGKRTGIVPPTMAGPIELKGRALQALPTPSEPNGEAGPAPLSAARPPLPDDMPPEVRRFAQRMRNTPQPDTRMEDTLTELGIDPSTLPS
jgi:hypothetical protein